MIIAKFYSASPKKYKDGHSKIFTKYSNVKDTRSQTLKLQKPGCIRDSRKYFFSHKVVGRWNSLDQEMVNAPSINLQGIKGFKALTQGDTHLIN